jgi:hypothetical protein
VSEQNEPITADANDQDGNNLENAPGTGGEADFSAPAGPLALTEASGEPESPSVAVSDGGRDPSNGRFAPGNRLSKGNHVGKKTARFRGRLFRAVSNEDFDEMARQLIDRAKAGERWAIQLALAYFCGPPEDVTQDRLVMLERAILYSGGREE